MASDSIERYIFDKKSAWDMLCEYFKLLIYLTKGMISKYIYIFPAALGGVMGLMIGASIFSVFEVGGFSLGFIFILTKQILLKLFRRSP